MKNVAFHSLLRWKMIVLPILCTTLIHFLLKGWEDLHFKLFKDVKAYLPTRPQIRLRKSSCCCCFVWPPSPPLQKEVAYSLAGSDAPQTGLTFEESGNGLIFVHHFQGNACLGSLSNFSNHVSKVEVLIWVSYPVSEYAPHLDAAVLLVWAFHFNRSQSSLKVVH